jgi:preprotein translocase subunit SecG
LYVNAAILLVILLVLVRRQAGVDLGSAAFGQMQAPIAGGGGVYVMPAQFHNEAWGCYLLDVD